MKTNETFGELMRLVACSGLALTLALGYAAKAKAATPLTDLHLNNGSSCPSGYSLVAAGGGLNGDLNQGAGGKDIYMCETRDPAKGQAIRDLLLSESKACPEGFERVRQTDLNGDLNEEAGGKDIFLCLSRTSDSSSVDALRLTPGACDESAGEARPRMRGDLNGDLNQGARNSSLLSSNKDIFLCLQREIVPAPTFSGSIAAAAKHFAPRVHSHPNEGWFPSSVSDFLDKAVKGPKNYYLPYVTDAGDWEFDGASGQKDQLQRGEVPIYAFVVEGKTDPNQPGEVFTDVVYFLFFPYNRGKEIGLISTVMGNHVGDWENVTIRFSHANGEYTPERISLSQHAHNKVFDWTSNQIAKTDGTHPNVYQARGSHAVYSTGGAFKYGSAAGSDLVDRTGSDPGTIWDTWNNVVVLEKKAQSEGEETIWTCTGHDGEPNAEDCETWANLPHSFRWGNLEDQIEPNFCAAGECRMNSGPTGPQSKSSVTKLSVFE